MRLAAGGAQVAVKRRVMESINKVKILPVHQLLILIGTVWMLKVLNVNMCIIPS
jgi:hypothetical protein